MRILLSSAPIWIAVALLTLCATSACETAPRRDPLEEGQTGEAFEKVEVADVVVLPVVNEVPEEELPEDRAFTFPEKHVRERMRGLLIQEKDFAVPTAAWSDATAADDLDTDAFLTLTLDQWDSSRLVRRGVVYAGGRFELRAAGTRDLLWSYECRDLQLAVTPPHGGQAAEGNMQDAAERLVDSALARMPKKITR